MIRPLIFAIVLCVLAAGTAEGQHAESLRARQGSETAKKGLRNEAEIAARFETWATDPDAQGWLTAMGYNTDEVTKIVVTKPHGEKADIAIKVTAGENSYTESISIKLVSTPNGFNQIDKRWVSTYAAKWQMPSEIVDALLLFVGEKVPATRGRRSERAFLDEFDPALQKKVIEFFATRKSEIVGDLLEGDGDGRADWFMVVWNRPNGQKWTIRNIKETAAYFADGDVAITRSGNLRIGRITMQRKGGDGGRKSAKMLQFKLNPALLFGKQ